MDGLKTKFDCAAVEEIRYDGEFRRLERVGAAAKIANRDYRLVEMYTFAALVYFIISFSLSYIVKILQQRIAIIR